MVVFFVIPLVIVVLYSVSHRESQGTVRMGFTLEHFRQMFQWLYVRIALRSVVYASVTTLLTLCLAFPMAYYMAFAPLRTKLFLLLVIVISYWTNYLIRLYSFIIILGKDGLANTLLLKLGIISAPLSLISSSLAVFVGFVYWNLPTMILPVFAALDRMDITLFEASMDLGANHRQTFCRIVAPYALPGLINGVIFVFVPTLGNFVVPDLLGGTDNVIIGNVITAQYLQARNWPFGSALSVLLIFVMVVVISLYIRFGNPVFQRKRLVEV